GNAKAFKFAEPKIDDLNFSFSGFKTSILYFIRKQEKENPDFIAENLNDICASVQFSIIQILMDKLKKAAKQYEIKEIAIAGGVSANSGLRNTLQDLAVQLGWNVYIPAFQYCTDNAGMIAIAGYHKYLNQDFVEQNVSPMARMEF
ncbi:MAG: tRNA (adenosine(37)-N6)-threonylcarbamoyltransferase complex transferase subunit TsaD, partial [Pedobacter sp.]